MILAHVGGANAADSGIAVGGALAGASQDSDGVTLGLSSLGSMTLKRRRGKVLHGALAGGGRFSSTRLQELTPSKSLTCSLKDVIELGEGHPVMRAYPGPGVMVSPGLISRGPRADGF